MTDTPTDTTPTQTEEYSWQSSGGCERCDSMQGRLYPEEPGRPHPHCNCTRDLVGYGPEFDCELGNLIQLEHAGSNHPAGQLPDPDDTLELVYDYRITCNDGFVYEGQVMVEMTYAELADLDSLDAAYEEAFDMVESIADDSCRPCEQGPVA